jgi:membrane protein implicated in regulation of membrane protease activity
VVGVLLALPIVALLWVASYAKDTPRLWGFPFFYWYQFLWVFLAAICTSIAYRLVTSFTARERDDR